MMRSSRAGWMRDGKFGLMVHWLPPGPPPRRGKPITDLDGAVDRFDLELFLNDFAKTGADWLIFTIGQKARKVRYGRAADAHLLNPARHSPQPPAGCLWHALVPIDCMWGHGGGFAPWQNSPYTIRRPRPGQMEPPLYSVPDLKRLVRDFKTAGGGVTFNVGIFQEGGLGPLTVKRLAELAGSLA